ncbi:MAG: gamma-glutamyl-gamma-aminobutyrate hydrolase family protein [Lachnospiraceae bacterium]|nr:gamma-glutamyl-gamma-aminobutyrate hydrolase family protein [Lachnospiraceae bacterium]
MTVVKKIGIIGGRDTYHRNCNYYEAVEKAGGKPIAVLDEDKADYYAETLDGLVLLGGGDINPLLYGSRNTRSIEIDDGRDRLEKTVLDSFLKAGKSVLGICRGMQMINVCLGGTLIQHLDDFEKHVWVDMETDNAHSIDIHDENSFMYKIYKEKEIVVNSAHHQAVDKLADGLRVAAVSDDDGVVEAFEHTKLPVIGVQFHPERMCLKNVREDTVCGFGIFEYFMDL